MGGRLVTAVGQAAMARVAPATMAKIVDVSCIFFGDYLVLIDENMRFCCEYALGDIYPRSSSLHDEETAILLLYTSVPVNTMLVGVRSQVFIRHRVRAKRKGVTGRAYTMPIKSGVHRSSNRGDINVMLRSVLQTSS